MQLLGPIAALLGIELTTLIARIKRSATTYAVLALCGVVALVFLLVAINVALSWWVGPLWAPLIIVLVAVVIAVVVLLASQAADRARERQEEERRRAAQATALASSAAMGALPLLKQRPWLAAALLPVGAAAAYAWYLYRGKDHRRH